MDESGNPPSRIPDLATLIKRLERLERENGELRARLEKLENAQQTERRALKMWLSALGTG